MGGTQQAQGPTRTWRTWDAIRTGVRPATRKLKHPSFVRGDLIDYFKRASSLALWSLVTPHLRFLLPQPNYLSFIQNEAFGALLDVLLP